MMKFVVPLLIFMAASCGGGGGGDSTPEPGETAAPSGVTALAGSGQVAIIWSPVTGATSYNLYYSTSTGVTKKTGIRIPFVISPSVVTPLTNGTTYYFVVTAVDANGESAESSEVSATPASIPPPSAPTGVTAVARSGQATISWDNVTGATSYNLYYSQSTAVTKETGIIIPNATSPKVVTPLANGTTYYFVVTAVNANGESVESTEVSAVPTDAPTGVTAAPGPHQATIDWSPVTGATAYNIYYSQNPGVTQATGTKVPGATSPSVVNPLNDGTIYYFVVTAVNSSGESAISSEVFATPTPFPPPPVPTGVTAAPGYGQAVVGWSPVTGATSYNIYYSTMSPVSKATGTKVAGVTSPGIVVGLTIGTRHFFAVTAENSDAESGISSEVSAIVSAEYIAIGDSITFGSNDDILSDGIGYEPILAGLLPATVANEGVGGVSSSDGAAFISSTLSKYPSAKYFLVLYGTNDADMCCGPPVSRGTYKANLQSIISSILAAGKVPFLSKVPYTTNTRYSVSSIQGYNLAIDELVAENGIAITPPDFYTLFQDPILLSSDGLHPNGTGFHSMANLWSIALTP